MTPAEVTRARIGEFLAAIGEDATPGDRIYLSGGATAVAKGWRTSTSCIDLRVEAAADTLPLFRTIAEVKDRQNIEVRTAGASDFIPAVPGWRQTSRYIGRFGNLDAFHTDYTFQALGKLNRALPAYLEDVDAMLARELTTAEKIGSAFNAIATELDRFPGIDPDAFERIVARVRDTGRATQPS